MCTRNAVQVFFYAVVILSFQWKAKAEEWKLPADIQFVPAIGVHPNGLLVRELLDHGCGLRQGDLITGISGTPVTARNVQSLMNRLAKGPRQAKIRVIHGFDAVWNSYVELGDYPGMGVSPVRESARLQLANKRPSEIVLITLTAKPWLEELTVQSKAQAEERETQRQRQVADYQRKRDQWEHDKNFHDEATRLEFRGVCPVHAEWEGRTSWWREGQGTPPVGEIKCRRSIDGKTCDLPMQWRATGHKSVVRIWPDGTRTDRRISPDGKITSFDLNPN
jgi:hypothetical protein